MRGVCERGIDEDRCLDVHIDTKSARIEADREFGTDAPDAAASAELCLEAGHPDHTHPGMGIVREQREQGGPFGWGETPAMGAVEEKDDG